MLADAANSLLAAVDTEGWGQCLTPLTASRIGGGGGSRAGAQPSVCSQLSVLIHVPSLPWVRNAALC